MLITIWCRHLESIQPEKASHSAEHSISEIGKSGSPETSNRVSAKTSAASFIVGVAFTISLGGLIELEYCSVPTYIPVHATHA